MRYIAYTKPSQISNTQIAQMDMKNDISVHLVSSPRGEIVARRVVAIKPRPVKHLWRRRLTGTLDRPSAPLANSIDVGLTVFDLQLVWASTDIDLQLMLAWAVFDVQLMWVWTVIDLQLMWAWTVSDLQLMWASTDIDLQLNTTYSLYCNYIIDLQLMWAWTVSDLQLMWVWTVIDLQLMWAWTVFDLQLM
ncbi:hypothetical protein J6590_010122 [Homalodisca vitripennis]|nr:hypothetical protein J6590_010122 [Homalodisca vitripennis]